jgi:hypothetical protein
MQQCCCQYGQSHEAEQDESGSRRQKTIERKCSIDGCICGNRTGGGKDARNVLLWDGSDAGGDFVATRPFARRDQQCGKDSGEENAHAWAEQALLDGEAHEKDAAERQRQAADPDDPLCTEFFFQCGGRCWGRRYGRWRDRGRFDRGGHRFCRRHGTRRRR